MNPALKRLIGVSVSLTFFLGAVVMFFSLVVPTSSEVQDLRGERNALSGLLEEESSRIEAVRALFEEYGNVATLQNTLAKALPAHEDVPSIINQLQGTAKASGITINSINISLPAIKTVKGETVIRPLGEVQVTVALSGDYNTIKTYLRAIETNVRIMDVKRLDLQGGVEGGSLTYNIVVNAYYQL